MKTDDIIKDLNQAMHEINALYQRIEECLALKHLDDHEKLLSIGSINEELGAITSEYI